MILLRINIQSSFVINKTIHYENIVKITCTLTSILFVYLFVQLLIFSDSFIKDLGLEPTTATLILARRTSMFMLGISVLMFLSKNLFDYKLRLIVSISTGVTLCGLSLTGIFELIKGNVNLSILTAIISESVLWISYAIIIVKYRQEKA